MTSYQSSIKQAESELAKHVQREAWSDANRAQGFLQGVKDATGNTPDWKQQIQEGIYAEMIEKKEYGDAAYWLSYISGRSHGELSIRLDNA